MNLSDSRFPRQLEVDDTAETIRQEQMVRYYGDYSPASGRDRGQRKKANEAGSVPCILQSEESSKEYRRN